MLFHIGGGFFFRGSTDLSHHQNGFGLAVFLEPFQTVNERSSNDWVAAKTHTCCLAKSKVRRLPNGFVSQRSRAGHNSDRAFLVNVAGHDSDLAFIRSDHAWAVWANQDRTRILSGFVDANHVDNRHALGNGDHNLDTRVDRFENCVSSKGRWDEDHGGVCAGLLSGFFDGIKHREAGDFLAALSRSDAANHLGAIIEAAACVKLTHVAGDPLADNFCVFIN